MSQQADQIESSLQLYLWVLFGTFLLDLSNLVTLNWEEFLKNVTWIWAVGGIVRMLVLGIIGCAMARAKKSQLKTILNCITFGAAIPMLVANLSMGSIENLSKMQVIQSASAQVIHAESHYETDQIVKEDQLYEMQWNAFWSGFLGNEPSEARDFAVIVICGDMEDIYRDYLYITEAHPHLNPEIHKCPNINKYLITLATKKTRQEAEAIKREVFEYLKTKCDPKTVQDILQGTSVVNAREDAKNGFF